MNRQRLTTRYLAMENIRRKPFRSFALVFLITLFACALFLGTVFTLSLSRGVSSLSDRLGADIMVVPQGYEVDIDSILLSGVPSSFYLPESVLEDLSTIDSIERMTPQTYIATLSASCCSYPVQIVGIDYDTDFLIRPWLTETMRQGLKDGEVIVGYRVAGQSGDRVKFFEKPFEISGRLEQTGMGFDATVFMTRKTAAELAVAAERIVKHPLSDDGSLISTVMVRLKPGYDSVQESRRITDKFADKGIFALHSKKFVNNVSSNLNVVTNYIKITIGLIFVLAVFVIALLFLMTLSERKKEMGVLRVLGASKRKLIALILAESSLISLYGAVLGTALAGVGIFVLFPIAKDRLNIPFLLPSPMSIVLIAAGCFLISVLTGPVSSLYSVYKLTRMDVYQNLRDVE